MASFIFWTHAGPASCVLYIPESDVFVDRVEIEAIAGKGGDGCMSFRRERYVPKGGPDGGDGGDGGSVIIVARAGVNSLVNLSHRRQVRATRGVHGMGSNRHGKAGDDCVLEVPPGTIVIDSKNGFVIKDLAQEGDQLIAARGGKGGKGNARFKSSTNQAPRQWTPGGEGEKRRIILELKVIADVGLVGMPNAGKSTLLSRLSSAKPEIANYPFTTKFPNLGQVQIDRDNSFVMADIPGLIEGAHSGVGLGHDFLKHIERAGIIVHLVEPLPMDQSDPIENYLSIRHELREYNPKLVERPEIVAVTKSELPGAEDVHERLKSETASRVMLISAVTGSGLPELVRQIADALREYASCN